ncbi:MAG: ATP-binding cassette domain-containing protein [Trueperaceae bacterium]|nr:MAG: ATP-binding cassette domain-containing protein [Trueperaceae bacterium]
MAALVEVDGLKKHFPVKGTILESLRGQRQVVRAVDGVSFRLEQGESVGLVGESGCGKTTTGRLLLKLLEPTEGSIRFDSQEVGALEGPELKAFRRQVQLIFQNPFEALNPRFTVYRSLAEPLVNAGIPKDEHPERMHRAMEHVHLHDTDLYYDKFPHQLSGGQLQRVVLARALVLEPSFVVADEPVSMLDVSVRAGILNVMREARDTLGLTAVYISHDLALVRYVCERTIVMYLGKVMEDGPTETVIKEPAHPYTQALVQAVPTPHPDQSHDPLPIHGGVPDAKAPPSGCRFRDRCPHAFERCALEEPKARELAPGHVVYCHLHD